MTRRFGARAGALAALVLLAASALLPIAAADHAYSHRYVVIGRVLDADDNPVQGVTVNLGSSDFQPEGQCANQPGIETEALGPTRTNPVTNQYGEFIYCFHTHSLSRVLPPKMILTVEGSNASHEFDMDPYTRHSFVTIHLEEPSEAANEEVLATTYTIMGNVWRDGGGETYLEGIRVYGLSLDYELVNITLEYNGKEPMRLNATTNNYGDFAIRVPVEERPTSGTVTFEVAGETFTHPVDGDSGMTAATLKLPEQKDPFVGKLLLTGGIVVGVVVVGGAGWYGVKRVQASREERAARERSTRKRANK